MINFMVAFGYGESQSENSSLGGEAREKPGGGGNRHFAFRGVCLKEYLTEILESYDNNVSCYI